MIEIYAFISQDYPNPFNNHSAILDCLQLLGDSSRGYKFQMFFCSDANVITNIISSILQMPPVKRCSHVEIDIPCLFGVQKQLPVEEISNWLGISVDDIETNDRKPREKYLKIKMHDIQNAREMINHLQMVHFIIKFTINFYEYS